MLWSESMMPTIVNTKSNQTNISAITEEVKDDSMTKGQGVCKSVTIPKIDNKSALNQKFNFPTKEYVELHKKHIQSHKNMFSPWSSDDNHDNNCNFTTGVNLELWQKHAYGTSKLNTLLSSADDSEEQDTLPDDYSVSWEIQDCGFNNNTTTNADKNTDTIVTDNFQVIGDETTKTDVLIQNIVMEEEKIYVKDNNMEAPSGLMGIKEVRL